MNARILLLGLGLCLPVVAARPASHQDAWRDLGAVYASQVPLLPGSVMIERSSAAAGGRRATIWRFRTREDLKTLVSFYEQMLPNSRRTPEDDGLVCFTFVPKGAGPAEFVIVMVGSGQIRISEQTAAGRHRANASM